MRSTPAPKVALLAVAAGALALLGLIVLTAQFHPVSMLESTKKGQLEAFLPEAERQLHMLQQEMPGGRVASSFPKYEHELNDLFSRTQQGMQKIEDKVVLKDQQKAQQLQQQQKAVAAAAQEPKRQEKKARMMDLAQASRRASKKDLAALVQKAGSTMYMLEHQLPVADRKMFPKEARELQDAFGSELGKLSKIRSELLPKKDKAAKKKAMRMSLAAKADSMPEHKLSTATQSALDNDEAKDVAENHKMAEADDMGDFFAAVNGPSQPASKSKDPKKRQMKVQEKKAREESMLEKAETEDHSDSDESVTNVRGDPVTDIPHSPQTQAAKKEGKGAAAVEAHSKGSPRDKKAESLRDLHIAELKAARKKGGRSTRQDTSPTGPRSSIQKWGTVFDPTLKWGHAQRAPDLMGKGKEYFDHYSKEAAAFNNVFDPVKDNHTPDINNWEVQEPTGRAVWWKHNHAGRGY